MSKLETNHYVDNALFLETIRKYKEALADSALNNTKPPRIPEYFGECVLKIANRLSYKGNFVNYTYRDDMVSDGVENSLHCINSFDTDRFSNPFAYFTQVIYYAFLRRIAKEKKIFRDKTAIVNNIDYIAYSVDIQDMEEDYKNMFTEFLIEHQYADTDCAIDEKPVKPVKEKPVKPKPLDEFFK